MNDEGEEMGRATSWLSLPMRGYEQIRAAIEGMIKPVISPHEGL